MKCSRKFKNSKNAEKRYWLIPFYRYNRAYINNIHQKYYYFIKISCFDIFREAISSSTSCCIKYYLHILNIFIYKFIRHAMLTQCNFFICVLKIDCGTFETNGNKILSSDGIRSYFLDRYIRKKCLRI